VVLAAAVLLDPEVDASEEGMARAGLEHTFSSHSHNYYKSARMHKLDAELGDIYGMVRDAEAKVVREVERLVQSRCEALVSAANCASEIDCALAFAVVAGELGWTRPTVDSSCTLSIHRGRHPLQELVVPSFIPNGTDMSGGEVHVVTGPNFSGKSVYVKQVRLAA